jgi:anti-sigma B factor antagonist
MADKVVLPLLTLDIERQGDVTVVHCHGKLVAGVSSTLYSQVCPLIKESKRIVLDLSDLSYMDSMGLGTLARLYVSSKAGGCELVLTHLGKRIRELLGVTHMLSVFTIIGEHGGMMKF